MMLARKATKLSCAAVLAFSLLAATPAYAATTPSPTPAAPGVASPSPTPSSTQTPPGTPGQVPGTQIAGANATTYNSLAAAMTAYYAHGKGTTLGQYINENPEQAAALFGTSVEGLSNLPTDDPAEMNKALDSRGITLDTDSYSNLSAAKQDINAKGASLDALIVTMGASYAEQLSTLRAPVLNNPSNPNLDGSIATSMPQEGLAFGLFLNKSLTDLVTNSPDVFNQIQSTGLGTPEAQAAWNKSMLNAMSNSSGDLTKMLPSACGGVFLSAMASGDASSASKAMPSSGGCGSCLVAGIYSHGQMSKIFDPNVGTINPMPGSGTVNPSEWSSLAPWQKNAITGQNKNLSSVLDSALGKSSSSSPVGCESSKAAVSSNAGKSLSSTLNFLNR